MLVYQRVIPPNGSTCFYKVRSKGLTKLQPWRALRNVYHCMTVHVQAMHNSPTAFSNHRRSTLVSLMRRNLCSIWAPLLVQFLEREHTRYRKFRQVHLGQHPFRACYQILVQKQKLLCMGTCSSAFVENAIGLLNRL